LPAASKSTSARSRAALTAVKQLAADRVTGLRQSPVAFWAAGDFFVIFQGSALLSQGFFSFFSLLNPFFPPLTLDFPILIVGTRFDRVAVKMRANPPGEYARAYYAIRTRRY
jgi:hypothetical protein